MMLKSYRRRYMYYVSPSIYKRTKCIKSTAFVFSLD
nr:MAG TPA: hypothetical protein [Caudoviricetes sp.]